MVANSSPLIALEQIGHLDLLKELFSTVLIPPAVARETAPSLAQPAWIVERALTQPISSRVLDASLGAGESEAISLALEVEARWIVLDDRPARRLAEAMGVPFIGTLGVLLACKRRNLLPAVRPCVDALMNLGFRVAPHLYERVLADAGEERA